MAELLATCQDSSGKYRWHHRAGNNRIDNASEQGYRWRRYAAFKARRRYPRLNVVHIGRCR